MAAVPSRIPSHVPADETGKRGHVPQRPAVARAGQRQGNSVGGLGETAATGARLKWPNYPKRGEPWITSECGKFRILKAFNESKLPNVEPVVYILWDLRTKPAGLVGPFLNLDDAKHEASKRAS